MKISELLTEETAEDKAVRLEINAIRKGKYASHPMPVSFGKFSVVNSMVSIDGRWNLKNTLIPKDGPDAGKLTFKMIKCGQIELGANRLSSFEGFPPDVSFTGDKMYGRTAIVTTCAHPLLTKLDGISKRIDGNLGLGLCHNLDWSNAHKHFEYIDGTLTMSNQWKGGVLWALKIPKLQALFFGQCSSEHRDVQVIISKYLRSESKDIVACQRELIEKDLDEYAEF
jgi:hypothetical protein